MENRDLIKDLLQEVCDELQFTLIVYEVNKRTYYKITDNKKFELTIFNYNNYWYAGAPTNNKLDLERNVNPSMYHVLKRIDYQYVKDFLYSTINGIRWSAENHIKFNQDRVSYCNNLMNKFKNSSINCCISTTLDFNLPPVPRIRLVK